MSMFTKPKQQPSSPALSTYTFSVSEFGTCVRFQAASPEEAGMIVDSINNLLAKATHEQIVKLAKKLNASPVSTIKTASKFC